MAVYRRNNFIRCAGHPGSTRRARRATSCPSGCCRQPGHPRRTRQLNPAKRSSRQRKRYGHRIICGYHGSHRCAQGYIVANQSDVLSSDNRDRERGLDGDIEEHRHSDLGDHRYRNHWRKPSELQSNPHLFEFLTCGRELHDKRQVQTQCNRHAYGGSEYPRQCHR